MFTLCLLQGCGGTEDDFTTEYASVNPQDDEADAGTEPADENGEGDDEDAGAPDIEGTDTSTMTWDEVCEYWEDVYNDGITAVCNRILDNKGIPRRGIKRTIAMSICRRKVQKAIDDAVCTIIDVITPDPEEEEEEDAGEDEDADGGVDEEEEEDAGEEEEDTDAGVPEDPEEEEEDPCDYDPYGC